MFQNLDAYKLKIIAILGMIMNHMAITWFPIIPASVVPVLYAAGGLTFPIMAYFVTEGYRHTSNFKRYILRLLLFAFIAMPFHIVALSLPIGGGNIMFYTFFNILFTIVFSLLILKMYDNMKSRVLFWILYIIFIVPFSMLLEWQFVGVTMVLMFHIIKNERARRIVPPVVAGVFMLGNSLLAGLSVQFADYLEYVPDVLAFNPDFIRIMPVFIVGCLLASFLLYNYNGEQGKRMKWLFYVIYPVHLAVLAGVGLALGII